MGLVGAALFGLGLATACGQALGGELSDILGSKRVMEFAVGARGLMVALMAWAMARGAPVILLISLHVLSGFCGSFYDSAVRSWIASAYAASHRLVAFGKLRVALNLGWAIGPALGGLLAGRSYPGLFAISAAACLLCFVLVRWTVVPMEKLRPESRFSWRETMRAAGDRQFLTFCAWCSLIAMVMAQLVASLSVHAVGYVGLSEQQVGLLFTLNGVIVVLIQTRVSRTLRHLRLSVVLAAGCLFYAAGYGFVGFAHGFIALAAAVAILTFGEVAVSPGLYTMAANLAPERFKGRYMGFHGLAQQLGVACGPFLGGLGLQHLSPRWAAAPWLLVAGMAAAAGWGFLSLGRRLTARQDGLHEEIPLETALAEVPV